MNPAWVNNVRLLDNCVARRALMCAVNGCEVCRGAQCDVWEIAHRPFIQRRRVQHVLHVEVVGFPANPGPDKRIECVRARRVRCLVDNA